MKIGALITISAFLAFAVAGKSVLLVSSVAASAPPDEAAELSAEDHEDNKDSDTEYGSDYETGERGGSASDLVKRLQAAIQQNQQQAEVLAQKEANLQAAETRLNKRLGELRTAQAQLEESIARLDRAASAEITALVRMYQSMKPSQAGAIFDEMDASFAAGFLTKMNADAAALILANMETQKAYAISIIIANRSTERPKS